jgi:hypothetical protein
MYNNIFPQPRTDTLTNAYIGFSEKNLTPFIGILFRFGQMEKI